MKTTTISDSFSRPANTDAYQDGDLVADNTTAGSVTPLAFHIGHGGAFVTGMVLDKTDESEVSNADFSVHLFGSSPTVANGDNGAISFDNASYIGKFTFNTMVAATDDAYAFLNYGDSGLPGGVFVGYDTVYALIEADAAYGPASGETFTLTLTIVRPR